jgi:transposase
MKLFIGLDVSLAKTGVCVIDEHGKIAKETQVPSEPQAIVDFANTLEGAVDIIGLEAGPLSQWLHRGLADARLNVVLMETRQVKGALKAMRIKRDPLSMIPRGFHRPRKLVHGSALLRRATSPGSVT